VGGQRPSLAEPALALFKDGRLLGLHAEQVVLVVVSDELCVRVFFNRRRQHCRTLFWDRNGFVMIAKRLEKGTFRVPWDDGETHQPWSLEAAELSLILEGIDLRGARKRSRWKPPEPLGKEP